MYGNGEKSLLTHCLLAEGLQRHTKQPQWSLFDVLHQLHYLKVYLGASITEKVNWGAALDLYFQRSELFFQPDCQTNLLT